MTGGLGGTYVFNATYNPNGSVATQSFPAVSNGTSNILPAETVVYGYDPNGLPAVTASAIDDYATATYYTFTNQLQELDLGLSATALWSQADDFYNQQTLQLQSTTIDRQSTGEALDSDLTYNYDDAGNITSATDSVTGDNQCYQYDYLSRLTAAWSQASSNCPSQVPSASGLGGPAPYEQQLTYNTTGTANSSTNGTTGLITNNTLITVSGSTATTTATTMGYPGNGNSQPHAPISEGISVNGGTPSEPTLSWNPDGTLAQIGTSSTTTLSNSWGADGMIPGQLSASTTPNGSGTIATNYRYDASGNLLIRQDAPSSGTTTTTLYLPDEEITSSGGTLATATRYYTDDGQIIAARTGVNSQSPSQSVDWLLADPNGTATTVIDANSQNIAQRYYTPFGVPLGTTGTGSFPGSRGYVGGTTDTSTSLVNLGAREYDPAIPAFIAPDPLLDPSTPADLDPYDYAYNDPVTNEDPTGQTVNTYQACANDDPNCGTSTGTTSLPAQGGWGDFFGGLINGDYQAAIAPFTFPSELASAISGHPAQSLLPSRIDIGNPDTSLYGAGVLAAGLIPGAFGDDEAVAADLTADDAGQLAIGAAPQRLAIEAAPQRLAIEAVPQRPAIEAAPAPEDTLDTGHALATVRRFLRQDEFDAVQKAIGGGDQEVQVGRYFTSDNISSPSAAAEQLALPGTDTNPLVGYIDVPVSSLPSEPFATFGPRLVNPAFYQSGGGLEIEVSELYGRPFVSTSNLSLVGF